MRSCRVSDIWAGWVNHHLPNLTLAGDRATWDSTLGIAEGAVVLNLMVFMPGPLVGSMMTMVSQVRNPAAATEAAVIEIVRDLVKRLHAARSSIVAAGGAPNGTVPIAGPKLVLP